MFNLIEILKKDENYPKPYHSFPKLLYLVWINRGDFPTEYDPKTKDGSVNLLCWWALNARKEYPNIWSYLPPETFTPIFLPQGEFIPPLAYFVWLQRQDYQHEYSLKTKFSIQKYMAHFFTDGIKEYALHDFMSNEVKLWLQEHNRISTEVYSININTLNRNHGVNLIGFARNRLGIGEDIRCMAMAFKEAMIPMSIVNINPVNNSSPSDYLVDRFVTNEWIYDVNVFCLTGFDTVRAFLELGANLFSGAYNIGNWPWELPSWPERWRCAFDLVDEVWGISQYCTDCYSKATNKPVLLMPPSLRSLTFPKIKRSDFGLPKDRFIFLTMFDFNSFIARKNPIGSLNAFEKAFGKSNNNGPLLVIKVMYANKLDPLWKSFIERVNNNSSILLINESWNYEKNISLIAASNCFLSLHRAEGFGRIIAEAMALGVPVIATGWSGSSDLVSEDRGFPVDYHLEPISPNSYMEVDGQVWAEPSIDHAAYLMDKIVNMSKEELRNNIKLAKNFVLKKHNLKSAGNRYRERIETIWTNLGS